MGIIAAIRHGKALGRGTGDAARCPVVYCYLVNREQEPTFKIGYTDDFAKRDRQHRASKLGVVVPAELLCVLRASRADETVLHRMFGEFRLPNEKEIFQSDAAIADWIRWLRDQYFVYVPDDAHCDLVEDLPQVAFDLWKPSSDRRKQATAESPLFDEGPTHLLFPARQLTADDFYTSDIILAATRLALGGSIDLDPASHAVANRKVQASAFYTVADNGLTRDWYGRVWLNPPFSQWKLWVPKIIAEYQSGRLISMCVLCATRTLSAQYFAAIREATAAMCILNGRIPFWGERAASPDDGHAVFYFGSDTHAFCDAFSPLGTVYLPAVR